LPRQTLSWCEAALGPVALGLVVGILAAVGHAGDWAVQDCGVDVAEGEDNRDGPYGVGDLPAIAYTRPIRGGSLHISAQLLNVDGTVDRKGDQQGQQEQNESNDCWPQHGVVRLARMDDQHRHGYQRR
jgi:hypothetical protein